MGGMSGEPSIMRDAITGLIGRYDQLGRYLDRPALESIETYLDQSTVRIAAVELINRDATEIVREASQRLFADEPELLLPGGNAYTTRRLAACLRDMDYFLRYASYALVAGDTTILNENKKKKKTPKKAAKKKKRGNREPGKDKQTKDKKKKG